MATCKYKFNKGLQVLQQTGTTIDEIMQAKLFVCSIQELSLNTSATAKYAPLDEITCIVVMTVIPSLAMLIPKIVMVQ